MKVLSFGSLNYDHVYQMDHFVEPKETQSSLAYSRGFGGKGLNQSIALAKAGVEVYHAGKVGYDGQDFIDYLNKYGVNTDYLTKDDSLATGHAIIQICKGQNCIILFGGANQEVTKTQAEETIAKFEAGDYIVLQNEINNLHWIMECAHKKGMRIVLNPSPMNEKIFTLPLQYVNWFLLNEIEAAQLSGTDSEEPEVLMRRVAERFPEAGIVLTLGSKGSVCRYRGELVFQDAVQVRAVDTTAAGDTFTGYFIAGIIAGQDIKTCMAKASKAAAVTVTRNGAAPSIPTMREVDQAVLV